MILHVRDIASVVLTLNDVTEFHDMERGPRKIVVRQDRLLPITYVERHYHDIIDIAATMMPHGQEMIFTATKRVSQLAVQLNPEMMIYVYRELRDTIEYRTLPSGADHRD